MNSLNDPIFNYPLNDNFFEDIPFILAQHADLSTMHSCRYLLDEQILCRYFTYFSGIERESLFRSSLFSDFKGRVLTQLTEICFKDKKLSKNLFPKGQKEYSDYQFELILKEKSKLLHSAVEYFIRDGFTIRWRIDWEQIKIFFDKHPKDFNFFLNLAYPDLVTQKCFLEIVGYRKYNSLQDIPLELYFKRGDVIDIRITHKTNLMYITSVVKHDMKFSLFNFRSQDLINFYNPLSLKF